MPTVDSLLEECGGLGRFQWILMTSLYMGLPAVPWSSLFMSFGGMIPDWYCLTASSSQSNYANATNFKACRVHGTPCETYRFEGNVKTIITEWDLVCERSWMKATTTSVQMLAMLVGTVVYGQLADRFGRKHPFYSALLLLTVANLATAFATSWLAFVCGRFLIGLAIGGIFVIRLPYVMEFMTIKWRPLLTTLPIWCLSMIAFSGITYVLADWRYLHILNGVTLVPAVLTWFLVPESARWLAVHGRIDDAVDVMRKVASTNGRKLPEDTRKVFEYVAMEERLDEGIYRRYSYLDLVNTWPFFKITFVVCLMGFSQTLIYYGVTINISSMQGSVYVNMFILNIIQVPAGPIGAIMANWIGRRWTVSSLFLLASLTSGTALLVHLFAKTEDKGAIISGLTFTTETVVSTIAYAAYTTWTAELYPTVVRVLGNGLLGAVGRIAGVISPFLINLDGDVTIPFSVIASLTLAVALLALTLPETKGQALPDSAPTQGVSVETPPDAAGETLPVTWEDVDRRGRKKRWGRVEAEII